MENEIPFRCECGTVSGFLETSGINFHGSCYCRDCRAYARFLGHPERMLDERGGSEVIGTIPSRLRFVSGAERLANVTMTPKGPYRWYADCCRSPIGNTPRSARAAYVGVPRCALAAPDEQVTRAFGPTRFVFASDSAIKPVRSTPLGTTVAVFQVVGNMLYALATGRWRGNPFFDAGGEPVRAAHRLSEEERRPLYDSAAR